MKCDTRVMSHRPAGTTKVRPFPDAGATTFGDPLPTLGSIVNPVSPAAMNNDLPALADAVCQHRPDLMRFASRRLRDAALAEDLVQDTLLAALQGAASFGHQASLRTWLTGILKNRIADSLRRAGRSPEAGHGSGRTADAGDTEDDERPGPEAVDWIDPPRHLAGRQFLDSLAACLAGLPQAEERLFTLREINGLDHEAAAAELHLSPRHASVLLHRARNRLRQGLALHGPA